MIATADPTRTTLQRDITEALLRLKLARCQRDRQEIQVHEEKLDWLLDRLTAHIRADEEVES